MQLRYISIPLLISEAGGDPWAINDSLQAGRPAQVSDLAEAFHAAGRCTAESSAAFDEARRRFEASWNRENGDHPINDSGEVQRVTTALGTQSLQLPKIGVNLENIAAALAEAQRTAGGQIATLEGQLQQVDNELGQALELEKNPHLTAADRSAIDALISRLEQQAIDDTKAAASQLEHIRNGYSDCLQKSLATLRADGYDPDVIRGAEGPQSPTPALPDDPGQFTQAWNSLSPQQKEAEYQQNPFIGNHPGMPFADKTTFNERHLDELTRTTQASVDAMQAHYDQLARQQYMGDHNAATADELAVLGPKLQAAKHSLDEYHGVQNAMKTPPGATKRYLGFLDDKGHAAVSIGNPDTATRNAILVPGTGDDLTNIDGNMARSSRMYQAALDANHDLRTGDISITTWLGYDRPMSVVDQAPWPSYAEHGAGALDSFEDGMRASHVGAPSTDTVIGHSYGTTLVGAAASGQHHLAADNVIAVASPGMLVDRATDLHINPGGTVYAMTDPHDPIGPANTFTQFTLGPNPTGANFGAHDLYAGTNLGTGPGKNFPSLEAHSGYWDFSTPALENLGAVIAGKPAPYPATG
jgi:hydrolase family protein/alpha/beta hydrolase family protein